MDFDVVKVLFDIGFGAAALVLWVKQGGINKRQVALDEKQSKATEDLTIMVKDHDRRIQVLERAKALRKARRK